MKPVPYARMNITNTQHHNFPHHVRHFALPTLLPAPRFYSLSPTMHQECTLEAVPKSEQPSSYIYAVPDQSAPAASHYDIPWTTSSPITTVAETKESYVAPKRPSRFLRWPALIFYALVIAVLAGVIGGFIGKTITARNTSPPSPSTALPSLSAAPLSSPTPTPSPTLFQRTLPIPTTGCTPPTQQRSFKSVTQFLAAQYTTFCATGWLNDELFAVSVASASDCVEACVMYNGHKRSQDRYVT